VDLKEEKTFQINNIVYVLGSPVIPVETLEQLAYSLSQQDAGNRPIVIINPQANTVPDFDKMLENYIENYTAGKQRQNVTTSYAFEMSSDEEIESLVKQQFQNIQSPDAQQQISIYQTIRRQSQIKHNLANYQEEASELWRQHCINPNATDGSERYAELVYQLMPQAEQELNQVSELLSHLNSGIKIQKSFQQTVEDTPEQAVSSKPEEEIRAEPEPVIELAQSSKIENESVSESQVDYENLELEFTTTCLCGEWRDAAMKQMPEAAALNMSQSVNYQKFQAQQSIDVPGYKPVELWVLCQLGIPLYPDGIPIVYTVDGKFQRVGNSDRSVLDTNYWFPRPIFENYFDAVL
jgi:tRNA A37 threonylcarbamoyladenosine modification protein TsaB